MAYENRKVLVGNLPITADEEHLRTLFAKCTGTVLGINMPKDAKGRNKGHAFIEMSNEAEAADAVNYLAGSELSGRLINITMADQPQDKQHQQGKQAKSGSRKWYEFGSKKD